MRPQLPDLHERLMRVCFRLAQRGEGLVSPNPLVGAVLVRGERIVARGFHRIFGGPHAEVNCLGSFHSSPAGTTLYVNLEPCSHAGKTPPCTDRIIASGVRTVVVAMEDPNPLVAGRGIRKLRKEGIRVLTGVLEDEAKALNRIFIRHITTGLPYVHVKIAQSLDGFIAGRGRRRWISSMPSRTLVHQWRATHDAILVGANTIIADDPSLNVRLARGRDPAVVILDGRLSVGRSAQVFRKTTRRVFIATDRALMAANPGKVKQLAACGVLFLPLKGRDGVLPLRVLLKRLYDLQIGSLLVEGGSRVFSQFLSMGYVDELSIFLAPHYLGSGIPSATILASAGGLQGRVQEYAVRNVGGDMLLKAFT